MVNLTSWSPPAAIPPAAPDFAFCHQSYGMRMNHQTALFIGGLLPRGNTPRLYTVNDPDSPVGSFDIPYYNTYSDVAVSIEVAGPVDIDQMNIVPDALRGMAGYLADNCIGSRRTGGFITLGIQELVNFVTNPASDLDAPDYPDNTVFLTVTLSRPARVALLPGDYDPQMALFLKQAEGVALDQVDPPSQLVIADRIVRYTVQLQRMRRLGQVAWWADDYLERNSNNTDTLVLQRPSNSSSSISPNQAAVRKRKRARRHLQDSLRTVIS